MRYEIALQPGRPFVRVVTHGVATLEGFRSFTDELVARRLPSTSQPVLVDHRDLDLSSLQKAEVDAFRRYVSELLSSYRLQPGAPTPRLATLVARTLDFGIVRQWEIPLDGVVPLQHRAFLDLQAAERWLTAGDDESPAEP